MKNLKRIISVLLTLAMTLSMVAGGGFTLAADVGQDVTFTDSSGVTWYAAITNTSDNYANLYTTSGGSLQQNTLIMIPSEIDGYTVTSMGNNAGGYAPNANGKAEYILFPSTVISTGNGVFYDYNYMLGISFAGDMTSISTDGSSFSVNRQVGDTAVLYGTSSSAYAIDGVIIVRGSNNYSSQTITGTNFTSEANNNGSIFPDGDYYVPDGMKDGGYTQIFDITADYDYVINTLTVDGEEVEAASDLASYALTYTFTSSSAGISVTFKDDTEGVNPDPVDPSAEPALDKSAITVSLEGTVVLTVENTDNVSSIAWSSANDGVATVSGNDPATTAAVTGVAIGRTTVTAAVTMNDDSISYLDCTVTVGSYDENGILDGAVAEGAELPDDLLDEPAYPGSADRYSNSTGVSTGDYYAYGDKLYRMVWGTNSEEREILGQTIETNCDEILANKLEVINYLYENEGMVYGEDYHLIRMYVYTETVSQQNRQGSYNFHCVFVYKEVDSYTGGVSTQTFYSEEDATLGLTNVSSLFVQGDNGTFTKIEVSNFCSNCNTRPDGPIEATNFYGIGSSILANGGQISLQNSYMVFDEDGDYTVLTLENPEILGTANTIYSLAGALVKLYGGKLFACSSGGHGPYVSHQGQIVINADDFYDGDGKVYAATERYAGYVNDDIDYIRENLLRDRPETNYGEAVRATDGNGEEITAGDSSTPHATYQFDDDAIAAFNAKDVDNNVTTITTVNSASSILATDSGGGLIVANQVSGVAYGTGSAGVYSIGNENPVYVYNSFLHNYLESNLTSINGYIFAFNSDVIGPIALSNSGTSDVYNSRLTAEIALEDLSGFYDLWDLTDEEAANALVDLIAEYVNAGYGNELVNSNYLALLAVMSDLNPLNFAGNWFRDKTQIPGRNGGNVAVVSNSGTTNITATQLVNNVYKEYGDEGAPNWLISGSGTVNFYNENSSTYWDLTEVDQGTTELYGNIRTYAAGGPPTFAEGKGTITVNFANSEWKGTVAERPAAGGTVNLTFDADSSWIVTGTCLVDSLTVAEGAIIKAPEGCALTITAGGTDYTTLPAGTYANVVITVTSAESAISDGIYYLTEGAWTFKIVVSGGTYDSAAITGYSGQNASKVIVPSVLGGVSVTAIADNANIREASAEAIFIPDTVGYIGYNAFYDCNKLQYISCANSSATINSDALISCNGRSIVTTGTPVTVTIVNPQKAAAAGGSYLVSSGYSITTDDVVGIAIGDYSFDPNPPIITFGGDDYEIAAAASPDIVIGGVTASELRYTFKALDESGAAAVNAEVSAWNRGLALTLKYEAGYYLNGDKVELSANVKAYDVSTGEEVNPLVSTGGIYKYVSYRDFENDGVIDVIYYSPYSLSSANDTASTVYWPGNLLIHQKAGRYNVTEKYLAFASGVIEADGKDNDADYSSVVISDTAAATYTADGSAVEANAVDAGRNSERSALWANDYASIIVDTLYANSTSAARWAKQGFEAGDSYNYELNMQWALNAVLYATGGGQITVGKDSEERSQIYSYGDTGNGIIAIGTGSEAGNEDAEYPTSRVYLYNADVEVKGWNSHVVDTIYGGYAYIENVNGTTGVYGSYLGQSSAAANDFGAGTVEIVDSTLTTYGNGSAGIYVIGSGVISAVDSHIKSQLESAYVVAGGGALTVEGGSGTGTSVYRARGGGGTSYITGVTMNHVAVDTAYEDYITGQTAYDAAMAWFDVWSVATGNTAPPNYMPGPDLSNQLTGQAGVTLGDICEAYGIGADARSTFYAKLDEIAADAGLNWMHSDSTLWRGGLLDSDIYGHPAGQTNTGKLVIAGGATGDYSNVPFLTNGVGNGGLTASVFEFEAANGITVEAEDITVNYSDNSYNYNYLISSEATSRATVNISDSQGLTGIIWNEGNITNRPVDGANKSGSSSLTVNFENSLFSGSFADGDNGLWTVDGLSYNRSGGSASSLNGNYYSASANWGITASFDKDSTWIVTYDSYIGSLAIEEGAQIIVPEGVEVTVTVSGEASGIEELAAGGTFTNIVITFSEKPTVTVTFDSNGGGDIDEQTVYYGSKLTQPEEPTRTGYTFKGWYTADGAEWDFNDVVTGDMTLYAQWDSSPSGGGTPSYTVTYYPNGGIGSSYSVSVKSGSTHTVLDVDSSALGYSRDGYTFIGWNTVSDGSGTSYKAGDVITSKAVVRLYAQWGEGIASSDTPLGDALPFTDVDENDWYYDAVVYVYENGLFSGTGNATFEPDTTLTREMFVTVLSRLAEKMGEDISGYSHRFADVPAGQWYSDAIAWGAANGIVNGYDENTFGLGDYVTREQMAVLFVRFAEYADMTLGTGESAAFTDASTISGWAADSVDAAVAAGLFTGYDDGSFRPRNTATRAEAATVFARFARSYSGE